MEDLYFMLVFILLEFLKKRYKLLYMSINFSNFVACLEKAIYSTHKKSTKKYILYEDLY